MTIYYIIGGAVAFIVLLFVIGYLKAPPDTAYIISGLGKKRILIGKAGWRVPFFERVDKLSLGVMQVDVKTTEAVPTNEFINVPLTVLLTSRCPPIPSFSSARQRHFSARHVRKW